MGGNIFKDKTRRYSKPEFERLSSDISNLLSSIPTCQYKIIDSYRNKESFGDIDIVIDIEQRNSVRILFQNYLRSTNGTIDSFLYYDFQLDFIFIPLEDFSSNYLYFAWNDLGNLMGRIYHKTGFKYGHKGLSFLFRNKNNKYKEIIVSKDQKKILEFVNYDYQTFLNGFDTLEEIFKYVVSTPYFNKDIYLLNNKNHNSRIRDEKRQTYHDFLNWIGQRDLISYNWKTVDERGGYRENKEWIEKSFIQFDEFKENYHQIKEEMIQHNLFTTKFNGKIITNCLEQQSDCSGKKLGAFIQFIKTQFDDKQFEQMILSRSTEEITTLIRHLYYSLYSHHLYVHDQDLFLELFDISLAF